MNEWLYEIHRWDFRSFTTKDRRTNDIIPIEGTSDIIPVEGTNE